MNVKLVGSFAKHIEVELSQGEEFYAEKGALIYVDTGIDVNSEMNGRGLGRLLGSAISGESIFIVHFCNRTPAPRKLTLGNHAGITHIKLNGNGIVCRRGAYMASSSRMDISSKFSIAGLVGGMGALLQRVTGFGTVFLATFGDPIVVDLMPGQSIRIDENHFVALDGITDDRINASWSLGNVIGGEGLSMLTVTGPGRVYLNP